MATSSWENMVPGSTTDYVPSNNTKKEEKEIDIPDIDLKGKVEFRKKNWFERKASTFKQTWPKALMEVVIPEMGKIFVNELFGTIYSSLFGEAYKGNVGKGGGYFFKNGVFDYSDIYGMKNRAPEGTTVAHKMAYDDFIFYSRVDVEQIIMQMIKIAKADGKVSVSTLYSIIRHTLERGKYPKEIIELLQNDVYTNTNYGWTLDDLRFVRPGTIGRDRYFLDLPEVRVIK